MDRMEALPGEHIVAFIERAKARVKVFGVPSIISHNGISLAVYPESHINDTLEIYELRKQMASIIRGFRQ